MTEPPEKKTFSGHANQYIIYVSYLEHQEYLEVRYFFISSKITINLKMKTK
jgi:hypothetical protein